MYFDANNQYGWSMSECLPTHGIKLLEEDQYNIHGVNDISWECKYMLLFVVIYFVVHPKFNYKNISLIKISKREPFFIILAISDDGEIGYALKVKLEYPQHLHDLHSEYPLAPESMEISKDMLSEQQLSLSNSRWKSSRKLVPNLYDKDKYVLHYRNLKLYLNHGMKLVKIYQVVSFHQSKWLLPYVEFCTKKRAATTSKFYQDLFKAFINMVFGK